MQLEANTSLLEGTRWDFQSVCAPFVFAHRDRCNHTAYLSPAAEPGLGGRQKVPGTTQGPSPLRFPPAWRELANHTWGCSYHGFSSLFSDFLLSKTDARGCHLGLKKLRGWGEEGRSSVTSCLHFSLLPTLFSSSCPSWQLCSPAGSQASPGGSGSTWPSTVP